MSGHDVAELLPFYANGTLGAADRARVDAELATCASCANELRELQALAAALRERAATEPSPGDNALDRALERIGSPQASTVTALRTSWWGVPVRYATAAVLVVGVGAAAAAALHAHADDVARTSQGVVATTGEQTTTLYRVHDATGPNAALKRDSAGAPAPKANVAQTESAPSVAKQHRLAKKARLELLVRDVETAMRGAQTAVRDAGGDMTSLDDATPRSADVVHGATLEAEVPAERLDATLGRLAALGAVQNRSVDAEDVGDAIVDEEARLRNLRREENDLRALMDKGGKVEDILDVQQHLSDVRGQIEQLDAQHQHDLHRVATSTISLELTEDRPNGAPAKPGPTARIDGAWHDGLRALADAVVSLLATIAWCVALSPLLLAIAPIAYAATRLLRRRSASA